MKKVVIMESTRNKKFEILAGGAMLLGALGFGVANNMSPLDMQSATLTVMLRATPIILILGYILYKKLFEAQIPETKNRIFVAIFCGIFIAGLTQALCMGYNKYGTQNAPETITSTIMDTGYTMSKKGGYRNYYVIVAHPKPEGEARQLHIKVRTEDVPAIKFNHTKIRYALHEGALGFAWIAPYQYEMVAE